MEHLIDIDEAKKLVTGVWGKQLEQVAADCVAPIFWIKNPFTQEQKVTNGTIFFLNTGSNCFAVSAYHVYKGYMQALREDQNLICQISDQLFEPTKCLLDFSKELDLITFNIEPQILSKIGKIFFEGYQSEWPPSPPEKEKGMFFAGYPGAERRFDNPTTINWGIFKGICVANSVGSETITVHFNSEDAVVRSDQIPQGYDSGGMSGAPLITLVEGKNGVNYWRLGGVIYEAQPKWDVLLARRADFILADGMIRKKLISNSDP